MKTISINSKSDIVVSITFDELKMLDSAIWEKAIRKRNSKEEFEEYDSLVDDIMNLRHEVLTAEQTA